MRHKKLGLGLAVLVLLLSAVLGATVLREPIAYAASPFQNVIVGNTDANPVPVHEQGTARVTDSDSPARDPALYSKSFEQEAQLVPAVPAGQRFIVSYITISESSTDPLHDCSLFLHTPDGSAHLIGAIPIAPETTQHSGSESVFIPLEAGQDLALFCIGASHVDASAAGYYVSAS